MNREDYQRAFDSLSFSEDFQAQTESLLRERARELKKEQTMILKKKKMLKMTAAVAAITVMLTASVSAAVLFLSPSDVASHMGSPALAAAFESDDAIAINQTKKVGDYDVTLEGLVSGKGLTSYSDEIDSSRTYTVFSISYSDGSPLTELPQLSYTPLVSGYHVSAVNAWTLNGGYAAFMDEGVYYYLFDTESLEMFADRTVYFAIYEGGAPSIQLFSMGEDGSLSMRDGVVGAMFVLPLDASKADPSAAEEFVKGTGLDFEPMTDEELDTLPVDEEPEVRLVESSDGGQVIEIGGENQLQSGLQKFTCSEFENYVADETERLKQQLAGGILSYSTYEKTVSDLTETLKGLKDGSLTVFKAGDGMDGYFVGTAGSAVPDGFQIDYSGTEQGISATIKDAD